MAGAPDLAALTRAVRAKDYGAQLEAREAGPAAAAALGPLLGEPDEEVRELAVHCLVESGAPEAGPPLVHAALDPDPQVAVAAARGLRARGSAALVPSMLGALERSGEPQVRRELALAIGRHAGPEAVPDLTEALGREPSEAAQQALVAALARLGDMGARERFAVALDGLQGVARKPWLELASYVGQPWLLGPLGSALADGTPLVRVGVDGRPDLIEALRACDLAVNLIAEIAGARFSFEVTPAKNYSGREIEEARRLVWSS
jgi:HEAT repeat protein